MKKYLVKDLMVPISEYATVSVGSTLFEAVLALEKAQLEYQHTEYKHRAILVLDKNDRVIGKVSQMKVLRAIENKNVHIEKINEIKKFGFSSLFINTINEQSKKDDISIEELFWETSKQKVEKFMKAPEEGEIVDENCSLDLAINQLIIGKHLSLLVTSNDEIVGILRMTDVFAAIFHSMKQIELKSKKDKRKK